MTSAAAVAGELGEGRVHPLDQAIPPGDDDGVGRGFQDGQMQPQLFLGQLARGDVVEDDLNCRSLPIGKERSDDFDVAELSVEPHDFLLDALGKSAFPQPLDPMRARCPSNRDETVRTAICPKAAPRRSPRTVAARRDSRTRFDRRD